jgi:hypothetical protein
MDIQAYAVTSYFWQVVDHWQTLIAGLFALVAGGIAYIAGLQQAWATTRASSKQLAAAARRDRLQARCIAVAVYPELGLLRVLHERASNIIANNFPAAEDRDTALITSVVRDARIRIPPFLDRNIDNLFIVEPAGATLLQLISYTMRYNDMIETLDRDRGTPRGTTPPTPPGIRVRTTAVRLV